MLGFMRPFLSAAKAVDQEPRWVRCHGTDLSAVGFLPARCSGSLEKTARSVPRRLWWFDVLLAASQCSVVPGSRRSPGNDEKKSVHTNKVGFPRESGERSEERRVGKVGEHA